MESSRPDRVNHSTFGARFVARHIGKLQGQILAYCIAGHHAGLPNESSTDDATQRSTLKARLDERNTIPSVLIPLPKFRVPKIVWEQPPAEDVAFALAFFTRMLFSCLIDADRTCTEAFCDPEQAEQRKQGRPTLDIMAEHLRSYLDTLQSTSAPTEVNRWRRHVLEQCRSAATLDPGFFSLQVPTGGGKTLSSLAFALDHARMNGLQRVIVAIPFTSIIEQTADAYRRALGGQAEQALVEHHTNVQPEHETRASQLATENWDAPLIVTTNVQLFESLFAAATTPCRKLHRIANSVILLDEAQTLPVELLAPTLMALRELVLRYGCTVVFCTATQPALERREDFSVGIQNVRRVIVEPTPLFEALRRVEVLHAGKLNDQELAARIADEERVLAIVNTRSQAAKVFHEVCKLVAPESCFHLSTLMCAAHRRQILEVIRAQVKVGACRAISTQLIEAGVDLDFPVVYRAEAGLDAIAQAAGRCNREGLLPGLGRTYVFESEQPPPPGFQRDTAQVAREYFSRFPNPLSPEAIDAYFRHYYWRSGDLLDKHGILDQMTIDMVRGQTHFQFREIADRYKIIRDTQLSILIPFVPQAQKFLDLLLGNHVPFVSQRLLQPYLVSVPERTFHALVTDGVVKNHDSGVGLLLRTDAYDPAQGLRVGEIGMDARAWGV